MKHSIFNSKKYTRLKQRKLYTILLSILIISLISGILFIFIISKENKEQVNELIINFFKNINNKEGLDYTNALINSLINNIFIVIFLFLLGLSIIGLPIIFIIFIIKSFIVGFSISAIMSNFGISGIIKALLYIFPHQIISLFLILIMCIFSVSFSINLFKHLFLKISINFKELMDKYLKVYLIIVGLYILLSLYEAYIASYLLRLFS